MRPNLALKGFFLLMSIGLFTTTCLGIYMSFKYNRTGVVWGLLIAGTALPGLLLIT
jgi:multisubunit Na+/H+ antiporter MnhC subunit